MVLWEELYKRHYPELLGYCLKACQDRAQAEDLAQEAFLKALQDPDTFEDLGPSQRRAWLFRTVKNLLCDRYRRCAVEERYLPELQADMAAAEPGYGQVEAQMLLQALPEQERTLFRLRYLEGYNASELAELLGLPPGTIRAKLSRSRKALKTLIGEPFMKPNRE